MYLTTSGGPKFEDEQERDAIVFDEEEEDATAFDPLEKEEEKEELEQEEQRRIVISLSSVLEQEEQQQDEQLQPDDDEDVFQPDDDEDVESEEDEDLKMDLEVYNPGTTPTPYGGVLELSKSTGYNPTDAFGRETSLSGLIVEGRTTC